MQIYANLSDQPFSTDTGRITLKNCLKDHFHLLKSPNLGCSLLDVMVLIRGFCCMTCMMKPTLSSSQ